MSEIIVIRADGNSEIGFGHLMRTQALARQLEKRGAKVVFLSRNPENVTGFDVECISSDWSLSEEDENAAGMLERCGADMLIIDSYDFNQERLDKMAGLDLLTVYIDDMNRHVFNVDYVLNGNLFAPKLDYRGQATFLLGSKYLMMRDEFAGLPARRIRNKVQDVLISLGAADMENITPWLLRTLLAYRNFSDLNWHVVIGPVFRNLKEIELIVAGRANVFLHHTPQVKNLMDFCDICISAAGSTTYELAACGVPALLLIAAENQVKLAEEAEVRGFGINLGRYGDMQPKLLFAALDRMIDDSKISREMAEKGQKLINGSGAGRAADILLEAVRRNKYAGNDTGQEDISDRRNRYGRQGSD